MKALSPGADSVGDVFGRVVLPHTNPGMQTKLQTLGSVEIRDNM